MRISGVINGASATNDSLLYSYIHDTANGPAYLVGTTSNLVDHNWFLRDWSTDTCHSEFGIKSDGTTGTSNLTIRFNYFENLWSTAMIATPEGGPAETNANLAIYGNLFFCNPNERTMGSGQVQNCPGGDGFILLFNDTFTNLKIFNNIFDNANNFGSGAPGSVDVGDGVSTTVNGALFQNNIFSNTTSTASSGFLCNSGASCSGVTYSYQSYFCGLAKWSGDTDSNAQVSSSCPYVNPAVDNYRLTFDTASWTALGAPYNVDLLGNTRTSSRGAFQYSGTPAPAPPTNLTASGNN